MKFVRLNLLPKHDLKDEILDFSGTHKSNGFILSVVGDLSRAAFKCPEKNEINYIEKHLEIVTLNGTVSNNSVHLHISVSDSNCQLWGGHLEQGSIVLKGVDILIGILEKKDTISELDSKLSESRFNFIEIAVLPNCPWSARAIRILNSNNIPHQIINIDTDDEFERINSISNSSTFPQFFIDREYIGGYDQFLDQFKNGRFYK